MAPKLTAAQKKAIATAQKAYDRVEVWEADGAVSARAVPRRDSVATTTSSHASVDAAKAAAAKKFPGVPVSTMAHPPA